MVYENLAKKGRGGDTEIRIVDKELSHVNAFEAYVLDNYDQEGEAFVKEHGSGTINPETGLREYIAPLVIAGGVMAAQTLYGAFKGGQQKKAAEEAKKAAAQIKQEEERMLTRKKELQDEKDLLAYSHGEGDISTQATAVIEKATVQGQGTALASGLELSSATKNTGVNIGETIKNAQSSLQKLVDTREIASEASNMNFQTGLVDIEKQQASIFAGIEEGGAGQGAMEGFMGSIGIGASLYSA